MNLKKYFLIGILLGLTSACAKSTYPKCSNDSQCKIEGKNGFCVFGQCEECGKDEDCASGKCEDYKCTSSLDGSDSQTKAKTPCISSAECDDGYMCEDGFCTYAATSSDDPTGKCQKQGMLFFDFDSFQIKASEKQLIWNFSECLNQFSDWKILLAGHTDSRGTTEYNLSLAEKRAVSVKKQLTQLGIPENRIEVTSFGKERPLDPLESEEAWAKNRRVELVVR